MTVTVTYGQDFVGGDINGDFQTNTFETVNQLAPDVLGLSGGGFVSAYNNFDVANGFILLDFYGADHVVIGEYQAPYEDTATDAIGQPKLTELANGNVLVVWDDNNGVQGDAGPQGAIYTAAGVQVLGQINLLGSNQTQFADVDVAALDGGGFVLTFISATDVFYRIYDSNGVQTTSEGGVNTVTAGVQADTQVTVLENGGFAVTWTDTNPADQLIKTRIFAADGDIRTGEIGVAAVGDNTRPSVAALLGGGYAIVYADTGLSEGPGISLQIVDPTGVVSAPVHVNADTASIAETDPDVTVLANGYIAVTWTAPPTAANGHIKCRIFNSTGVPVMDEFFIAAGSAIEVASAVSALSEGLFVTSWQDTTPDADAGAIWSQITEITRTVIGDGTNDSYEGDELRDSMDGGGAHDSLDGAAGDDTLAGGTGFDTLDGGTGADLLQGDANNDTIRGGAGNDRIYAATRAAPHGSTAGDTIFGDGGVDRIRGSAGGDTIYGGAQGDKINGGDGSDHIDGGDDLDKLKGSAGDDVIEGGYNVDTINGGVGDDVLYAKNADDLDGSGDGDRMNGANGDDTMTGSGGADELVGLGVKDVMSGRGADDTLSGGTGKDLITGGLGADVLTGGSDKDTFVYEAVLDSANGDEDLITDLGNLDVIDLSAIDAKTGPGDHAFVLVAAFTGAKGQLVVDYHAGGPYAGLTTIQGDVDGDGAADFTITVTGDKHVFDNFLL